MNRVFMHMAVLAVCAAPDANTWAQTSAAAGSDSSQCAGVSFPHRFSAADHAALNTRLFTGGATLHRGFGGHRDHADFPCDDHSGFFVRRVVVTGVPWVFGSYGYSPFYDPYAYDLANRNVLLRRELDELERQNVQLRKQLKDDAGVRVNVGPRLNRAEKTKQARSQQQMEAGVRLFRAGRFSAAAERFQSAAEASAEATPYFLLAHARFASRRYAEAVQSLKRGIEINPDWLMLDFDARALYADPELIVTQLAHLAIEVEANPLDRDRLLLLGFELFVTGQTDRARPILEQVARLSNNDAHVKPFLDYYAARDPNEADLPEQSDDNGD
jgi:hypothetical protein